jgi:hypothetical protein
MKIYILILTFLFLPHAVVFATEQEKTPVAVTSDYKNQTIFTFENANADKFDITLQVLGEYPINTKLGTDRFQSCVTELQKRDINIDFKPSPEKDILLVLLKFGIPPGKTMKTSEVLFVLDHYGVRPADICEAISLDIVDQSILDTELKVFVFGTFIPLSKNRTMIFIPIYKSSKLALSERANLDTALKTGNVWQGEIIIPVIHH